jgi:hypothetical protein
MAKVETMALLLREEEEPQFSNDRIGVTRKTADMLARVFNHMVDRGVERSRAQRFSLQCVVCLFAEHIDLLPKGFFSELLDDCASAAASSYDLLGGLFRQMNTPRPATGGRFEGVPYFNGSIFAVVEPVELVRDEVAVLAAAGKEDWSRVHPAIFGTLFQSSMGKSERHALGAHFTSEAEIHKIVLPTIVRPWRDRIARAKTLEQLRALRGELESFQILDPACGSGNFLYVAYRELVRVEMELVTRIRTELGSTVAGRKRARHEVATSSGIGLEQLHGIDKSELAVELAKVTLLLARKLAHDEASALLGEEPQGLAFMMDDPLPLETLDRNIVAGDALFCDWPRADAIVGNPPYQSKNKMQEELGPDYVASVRERYPEVPGRADYCVYWFRKAHDHLAKGGYAGLVGTNTIRQNYSREGGLDYITQNGGTIVEAVSTQVWPGDAVVHVSIVSWTKGGAAPKERLLTWQDGDARDSPWRIAKLAAIGPSLSAELDVTTARPIGANERSQGCLQGLIHGHEGFLLTPSEAQKLLHKSAKNRDVMFPYLIADDLLGRNDGTPSRWVIDFTQRDEHAASAYQQPFARVRELVMPWVVGKAAEERKRTGRATGPRQSHAGRWWMHWRSRPELTALLAELPRYIACSRVTKRPIFAFVGSAIRPNDALQVFPLPDDYSFGILQSTLHWKWFQARCSTFKRDFRYTSDTVFDSFPWPQAPTLAQARRVAKAAVALRLLRSKVMDDLGISLRQLYRQLDDPGRSPVGDAQQALDEAVRVAYGAGTGEDELGFLLARNVALVAAEESGEEVVGPGLPPSVGDGRSFVTGDCVPAPDLPELQVSSRATRAPSRPPTPPKQNAPQR